MTSDDVCRILVEVLGIDTAKMRLNEDTRLLGSLPEFDSMAVVSVLTAIEDHFGIVVDDDEVDGAIFETVGTLVAFVAAKGG
jgi:acyl carrier protein